MIQKQINIIIILAVLSGSIAITSIINIAMGNEKMALALFITGLLPLSYSIAFLITLPRIK